MNAFPTSCMIFPFPANLYSSAKILPRLVSLPFIHLSLSLSTILSFHLNSIFSILSVTLFPLPFLTPLPCCCHVAHHQVFILQQCCTQHPGQCCTPRGGRKEVHRQQDRCPEVQDGPCLLSQKINWRFFTLQELRILRSASLWPPLTVLAFHPHIFCLIILLLITDKPFYILHMCLTVIGGRLTHNVQQKNYSSINTACIVQHLPVCVRFWECEGHSTLVWFGQMLSPTAHPI